MITILRGELFHTPRSPFSDAGALAWFDDGAVAFDDNGGILTTDSYLAVRRLYPDAEVHQVPDAILLPGMVDTHVHYPQLGIIGAMGLRLLEWLQTRTLPEEARLADDTVARETARSFLRQLVANGTTTALVFGSHFPRAQDILFNAAQDSGLRITSGLVVSDRELLPELHRTPEQAYDASEALISRWHERGRLRYAVTPRFSLSCTDGMLEACGAALRARERLFFTTHLNENPDEIRVVAELFPWSRDYLQTYERFSLVGERSIFAHNVHVSDDELSRLATAGACIAHCPSSNSFLGSGLFAMRRHLERGVRFALGSDVGAGTSFSLLSEGQFAYIAQMLRPDGRRLGPAELLYLATAAGARALELSDQVGDFAPGKSADLVLLRPPAGSTLRAVLQRNTSPEARLGAIFTLAREASVCEVRVAGRVVHSTLEADHDARDHGGAGETPRYRRERRGA
ncbi:MAG: guanine deaminase [Solirubrobacterales bacterium]|nr:guanine deaminase [Solirubrobacterales bacterium]